MLINDPEENKIKHYLKKLTDDILITSLITFALFLALENLKTGLISNYFDINLLLIVTGFSIIVILFFKDNSLSKTDKKPSFTLFCFFIIIYSLLSYLVLDIGLYLKVIIIFFLVLTLLIYYKKHDRID